MNKQRIFFLVVLSVFTMSSLQAQFKAGLGVHYATDINSIGISVNGQYDIDDVWAATGAFTFFLENDYVRWSALDFNANYRITDFAETGYLYGIGGLSFTMVTIDYGDVYGGWGGIESSTASYVGLNLGVGANFAITDEISIAPEMVYSIGSIGYLRLGAKVMYAF